MDHLTVIIGAGLTGLTTAAFLRAAGRPVLVLERAAHIGGQIRTYREEPAGTAEPFEPAVESAAVPVAVGTPERLEPAGTSEEVVEPVGSAEVPVPIGSAGSPEPAAEPAAGSVGTPGQAPEPAESDRDRKSVV